MTVWTIPGDHTISKNFGASFDVSSSHHDYKSGVFTAVLEMRDVVTADWLGPKVLLRADETGTKITVIDGTVSEFPAITFSHAGVQALLDRAKIVTFVSGKIADPRPAP